MSFQQQAQEHKDELVKWAKLQAHASRLEPQSNKITVIKAQKSNLHNHTQLLLQLTKPTLIFQTGKIAFNNGRGEPRDVTDHEVALCQVTKLKFFLPRFDQNQINFVRKYGFPPYDAYFGIPANPVKEHLIKISRKLKNQCWL